MRIQPEPDTGVERDNDYEWYSWGSRRPVEVRRARVSVHADSNREMFQLRSCRGIRSHALQIWICSEEAQRLKLVSLLFRMAATFNNITDFHLERDMAEKPCLSRSTSRWINLAEDRKESPGSHERSDF